MPGFSIRHPTISDCVAGYGIGLEPFQEALSLNLFPSIFTQELGLLGDDVEMSGHLSQAVASLIANVRYVSSTNQEARPSSSDISVWEGGSAPGAG